jgi:general secretion pathway protein D
MKSYGILCLGLFLCAQASMGQGYTSEVFALLENAKNETSLVEVEESEPVESVEVRESSEANLPESSSANEIAESTWEPTLLERGIDFYRSGDLEKAETVFEAVLQEDPYNRTAMTYLQRIAAKLAAVSQTKQVADRARALAEVERSWNKELRVYGLPVDEDSQEKKSESELAVDDMMKRVKAIQIPSLDFRDADIRDVVLFLTETCRRQDAEGINILTLGMDEMMGGSITISIRDLSLFEALQYITEMASLKFDVQANAVAIMPVGYVAPSELQLVSYDVIPEVGQELENMSSDSGGGIDDLFGDTSTTSMGGPIDVVGFFSIVDWPQGASAVYQPNFHKLFVKNTPKNLGQVEDILYDLKEEAIKRRSQQVEIEAKFVEYNEGALEELGFDWTIYDDGDLADFSLKQGGTYFTRGNTYPVNSGVSGADGIVYNDPVSGAKTIGSVAGVDGQSLFGTAQRDNTGAFDSTGRNGLGGLASLMGGSPATLVFQNYNDLPLDLAINAMEQEGTADVLSAPKVTTKSGNEAVIRVVEVHRYPQDYDVETGQRTAPVVKPQDWEEYDLGVVLKVTPVVDVESNTIDLDLQPEITKFLGYDNYLVGINAYESGGNNVSQLFGNSEELIARMPYFEKRSIQTQVTISDGSTVVMGGLVDERTETFRDQVPFLGDIPYVGRFFRSEGSRNQKKNLVITVKATQVDDRGMTREERALERDSAAR